jgi:predicted metal-dependent hydrolase
MDLGLKTEIIRSKRRSISMHVTPDKVLVIRAPQRISDREIQKFIENNSEWVEKQVARLPEKAPTKFQRTYKTGDEFWYLGKLHKLEIGNYKEIKIKDDKLLFPNFLEFRIQKELQAWYIKTAKQLITDRVDSYAKQMDVSYTALSFSDTKSRWGACSHDNQLQFNWRLIMAPLLTINYVVVHELAHITEKNHSQRFWSIIRFYNPSHKAQIKWLKKYGETLVI